MSEVEVSLKKRKRIKLECLICGSVFDDDYRSKHENKIHGGKRVRVKHVGAPNNPFDLARKNFQKQTVETDLKSCKDEYLICPDTTRDTKTHSSPIQSIKSETITSESTGSMTVKSDLTSEAMTVETDLKSCKDEYLICPDTSASHVNLEEAVDMFANLKNRRYPFIV